MISPNASDLPDVACRATGRAMRPSREARLLVPCHSSKSALMVAGSLAVLGRTRDARPNPGMIGNYRSNSETLHSMHRHYRTCTPKHLLW
jgi:hypothetical protein